MGHLYKEILGDRELVAEFYKFRRRVGIEQVLRDACSLSLPVQPESPGTMMETISPDDHVNGSMELNPANLCTGQILLVVDMVDLIIFNYGKNTAQMSYDTGLSAVVNVAASDNMGADVFLGPSFTLCLADRVAFGLCAGLGTLMRPFVVIFGLQIFTQ